MEWLGGGEGGKSSGSSDWIDAFLKNTPDLLGGLDLFTKGITEKASAALTIAEGEADTAIYSQYLKDFPQYETFKEGQYKAEENQTLADRLAKMGMRGQTTGGAGAPTSAATAYTGEQSLWEQGYQTLQNQLALQKTEAQQKLNVATATTQAGKTEQVMGGIGEALGAIETGAGIGSLIGGVPGALIGGSIGLIGDLLFQAFRGGK
jgi:hypothetical protein